MSNTDGGKDSDCVALNWQRVLNVTRMARALAVLLFCSIALQYSLLLATQFANSAHTQDGTTIYS
jgi:hypothetical protein